MPMRAVKQSDALEDVHAAIGPIARATLRKVVGHRRARPLPRPRASRRHPPRPRPTATAGSPPSPPPTEPPMAASVAGGVTSREPAETGEQRKSGQQHHAGPRILAGVDGSPSSVSALRWATWQAALTGAAVDAVIRWHYPAAAGGYGWAQAGTDEDLNFRENAEKTLADAISSAVGPGQRLSGARPRRRGQSRAGTARRLRRCRSPGGGQPRTRRVHRGAAGLGQPALRASRALPCCRDPRPGPGPHRRCGLGLDSARS